MPWGDRTGPMGLGPRTGRGLGYCNGYDSPGYTKGVPIGRGFGWGAGWGRGWGRGFGRGWRGFGRFGWGRWSYPYYNQPVSPADERKILEDELNYLKSQMDAINQRLEDLDKDSE